MTATTTAPTDPAQAAAEDVWRPKLIAELDDLPDRVLAKLIDADIETLGQLATETLEGDAPDRLKRHKLDGEQIAALMDLMDREKKAALEQVNKPADKPLPAPTHGEKGYERKFNVTIGKVSIGKGKVSCGVKMSLAGESGHVGYRRPLVERYFINSQLDIEIGSGEQMELDPAGKKLFHAVGTTKRVSFGEKDASFTLSFERSAIDVLGLAAYADFDCVMSANLNEGPGLDEDDPDDDTDDE